MTPLVAPLGSSLSSRAVIRGVLAAPACRQEQRVGGVRPTAAPALDAQAARPLNAGASTRQTSSPVTRLAARDPGEAGLRHWCGSRSLPHLGLVVLTHDSPCTGDPLHRGRAPLCGVDGGLRPHQRPALGRLPRVGARLVGGAPGPSAHPLGRVASTGAAARRRPPALRAWRTPLPCPAVRFAAAAPVAGEQAPSNVVCGGVVT
jgi:hypothetical protein